MAIGILGLLLTGFALAACTNQVKVTTELPQPLVRSVPLDVGVHYGEDFRGFQHSQLYYNRLTWLVDLGASQVAAFDQVFSALFEEVEPLATAPKGTTAEGLDGLIQPVIEDFEVAVPGQWGADFYQVWVRYRIELYTGQGELIAYWPVLGYGQSNAGMFKSGESVEQATELALRDAVAEIAIGFNEAPEVQRWLAQVSPAEATTQQAADATAE